MSESERFLPHLKQVRAAAHELPDAELWPGEEYIVELHKVHHQPPDHLQALSYHSKSRGKTYKWLYEGKMWVS